MKEFIKDWLKMLVAIGVLVGTVWGLITLAESFPMAYFFTLLVYLSVVLTYFLRDK